MDVSPQPSCLVVPKPTWSESWKKYGKYILDISPSMENGGKMVGNARKNPWQNGCKNN